MVTGVRPSKCQHIFYRDIKNLQNQAVNGTAASVRKEAARKLHEKSFHYSNENAFDGLDFGGNVPCADMQHGQQ